MGLLSRGQAMITRTMQDMEPVAVTYTRVTGGETFSVELTGWLGRTLFAGLIEQEVSVQWGELDVLFAAADLILDAATTTPTAGDRLAFTVNGTAMNWEVASPDTGEPAWRWSDHYRTRLRAHLKRVA